MKRLCSLVLALALCLGLCVPAGAAEFSDVPAGHAFYGGILYCAENGIAGGYSDGTFQPSKTVTRNNFVVMLSRAFFADDLAEYNTETYLKYGTFVPNSMALFVNGILRNTSFETIFKNSQEMNQGISRYDMAQLMTNIMTKKGFAAGEAEKAAAVSQITDYSSIPSQYRDAVANVYALGIIGGYSDGTFGGEVTMNRGQAAVVIYRMTQAVPVEAPAPETPADPEPETPSTPTTPETPSTPAAGTLTNGKAITEANVTEILNQLKSQYPNGTDFANGYAGLNSGRNPNANCIKQITNQYWRAENHNQHTSTTFGCGGWAAFVADEIFGQTGVTWKKTTTSNLRPGDLMISIDNAGYLTHVSICVGPVDGYATNVRVYTTDASEGGQGYHLGWNRAVTSFSNGSLDCYTAYPN